MPTTNDEAISHLNDLVETCKDEEKGFREAARHVGDDGEAKLRTLLNLYAQQRAGFAADLKDEVLKRGGEPAASGHFSSTLRRGWLELKSQLKSGPDYADKDDYEFSVLSSCEAGEKIAMEDYARILEKGLPADLETMVESQYVEIRNAIDQMHSLSLAYKPIG